MAPGDGDDPRRADEERRPRRSTAPRARPRSPTTSSSRRWTRRCRRAARDRADLRNALRNGEFELVLPAACRAQGEPHHRLRGAAALAPSRARRDLAGRVHPGRRGNRPHRADRRMGAARGLRRGGALAQARAGGGQPLAGAVQEPQPAADRAVGALAMPAVCRRAGSSWKSPSGAARRHRADASPSCTGCASSASASRWTTSAPAIPR